LISIRKLPLDTPYLRGLISFLNIGMVGFVLASVALRFVFPEISLEGRSWWALRSAPLNLWSILWGKFVSGVVPLSVAGGILVWVSNRFLNVDPFVVRLSTVTVLAMSVTLTGMGVGFGALFPRFNMENVAQIQTSMGGVLYMVTALFYVGLTLALEAVVMRMYYFQKLAGASAWSSGLAAAVAAVLILVNIAAAGLPVLLGKRSLENADI
jgi:ABC-2 type transport system permease protein